MYRFCVTNNKADHKAFVVCFGLFACCFSAFLTTLFAQVLTLCLSLLVGLFCWRWYTHQHPIKGTLIIDSPHCHFVNSEKEITGKIGCKSRAYQHSVWLNIIGLSRTHWLIINANGCDEQSFTRLKRAVLISSADVSVSK
ncbi:hypothetical protein C7Y70_02180 [Pseudoalteromonas sp. KS88]|nr:hypothetical protein C7Y70_02180 [Pseudoalteromonas sp. KS88]